MMCRMWGWNTPSPINCWTDTPSRKPCDRLMYGPRNNGVRRTLSTDSNSPHLRISRGSANGYAVSWYFRKLRTIFSV